MKKRLISLLLCVCLLLPAACFLTSCSDFVYPDADKYLAGNGEYAEEIRSVEIYWRQGQVTFEPYEGDTLLISEKTPEEDDELKVHHYFDGETLYIRFCASGRGNIFGNSDKELTVHYPARPIKGYADYAEAYENGAFLFDRVRIDIVSGRIVCDVSSTKELSLGSSSGDIDCTSDCCGSGSITVTSGNVKGVFHIVRSLECDSTSGNAEIRITGKAEEVKADAASGEIRLDCEDARTGSVASLESTSGGITVTEPKDGFSELKIDTTSGDVRVGLQKEDCSILAETTSGDFRCDFPALMKDGQYIIGEGKNRIVIDTTSGNIEIFKP